MKRPAITSSASSPLSNPHRSVSETLNCCWTSFVNSFGTDAINLINALKHTGSALNFKIIRKKPTEIEIMPNKVSAACARRVER
jgi:hypothetical protein